MPFLHRASIPAVSVDQAFAAVQAPSDTALVDVRGVDEWAAGHAPVAHHVPLNQLGASSLPRATTLYVVCRSGNRSARAVEVLQRAGYNAHNVVGGMQAWARAGHPVVRDDGRAGMVV